MLAKFPNNDKMTWKLVKNKTWWISICISHDLWPWIFVKISINLKLPLKNSFLVEKLHLERTNDMKFATCLRHLVAFSHFELILTNLEIWETWWYGVSIVDIEQKLFFKNTFLEIILLTFLLLLFKIWEEHSLKMLHINASQIS